MKKWPLLFIPLTIWAIRYIRHAPSRDPITAQTRQSEPRHPISSKSRASTRQSEPRHPLSSKSRASARQSEPRQLQPRQSAWRLISAATLTLNGLAYAILLCLFGYWGFYAVL